MNDNRTRELCWFVLFGAMGFGFCLDHVRVDGNVWHEPVQWWDYAIDAIWSGSFVAAAVVGLRSQFCYRHALVLVVIFAIGWRLFWQNGRSSWFQMFDLPVFGVLVFTSSYGLAKSRIRDLTLGRWFVDYLCVSLLSGAALTLALLFAVYFPSLSLAPVVHRDREIVETMRRMAAIGAIVSCLCGVLLGVMVPLAWHRFRKYRKQIIRPELTRTQDPGFDR